MEKLNYDNIANIKKSKVNFKDTMKTIIKKVKDELINDEIKNEFIYPIYNEIYMRILPHYISFVAFLSTIVILLLLLIIININININNTNK